MLWKIGRVLHCKIEMTNEKWFTLKLLNLLKKLKKQKNKKKKKILFSSMNNTYTYQYRW